MIKPPFPTGSGGVSFVRRNGGSVGVGDGILVAVALGSDVLVGVDVAENVGIVAAVDVGVGGSTVGVANTTATVFVRVGSG
jgi:hypothetical protein